jgi:hypothetical protein
MTQDEIIVNTLQEAISEYELKHPGAIQKIFKEVTADNCYHGEFREIFNNACCVIVEPNAYLGKSNIDFQWYYDICEEDNYNFVKQQIRNRDENVDAWFHLIDILNMNGY